MPFSPPIACVSFLAWDKALFSGIRLEKLEILCFFRGQDMDIDLLFKTQRKGGALGAQDEAS